MARLKQMRTESVHCIVTSPPYFGLRCYDTEPQIWGGDSECLHLFGPSGRKGGGSHTHTASSQQNGHGQMEQHERISKASTGQFCSRCQAWKGELGLEPTIALYLSHIVMIFEELRRVLRKDGTCWLNIGDSYAGSWGAQSHLDTPKTISRNQIKNHPKRASHTGSIRSAGLKPKDLTMMPARMALALQAAGWWVRSDVIWNKEAPMPESVSDRPTVSYEHVFLLTKRAKYFYDEFAVREGVTGNTHPRGNVNNPKQALPGSGVRANSSFESACREVVGSRNLRSVWHIPAEPHSDCLCNVCGRYYENPRGLKREKLDVDAPARGPRDAGRDEIGLRDSTKFGRGAGWREKQKPVGGWSAGDHAHTELDGNYSEERLGKIICECGASDWTQHFAAYPTKLVDICVRAATSEKGVCPQCLAPWIRIVEKPKGPPASWNGSKFDDGKNLEVHPNAGKRQAGKWSGQDKQSSGFRLIQNIKDARAAGMPHDQPFAEPVTVGWKQSCKCEPAEPISATVLDPFGGMGTTAIVALRLGRDAILIELQPQYARMAEIRTQQDAPLFNHVTVDRPEASVADIKIALA